MIVQVISVLCLCRDLYSLYFALLPASCFQFSAPTGSPGRTQGELVLTRVKGEKVQLGWASSCLHSSSLPQAAMYPACLCCSSPCHSRRDPVFACALPQLSESLDPCLFSWPLTHLSAKTSSVICSFVLVTTLSWVPQLAVNTTQTE